MKDVNGKLIRTGDIIEIYGACINGLIGDLFVIVGSDHPYFIYGSQKRFSPKGNLRLGMLGYDNNYNISFKTNWPDITGGKLNEHGQRLAKEIEEYNIKYATLEVIAPREREARKGVIKNLETFEFIERMDYLKTGDESYRIAADHYKDVLERKRTEYNL